jgi:hypothetical protein
MPRARPTKAPAVPPNRCANCVHFVAPDNARSAMRPDMGECHRYPMQVFADEDGLSYCWSPALPDEVCGEHSRRHDA